MSDDLADRLRDHVGFLASVPRPPGSTAHSLAAEFIQAHLRQAGFMVEEVQDQEAG